VTPAHLTVNEQAGTGGAVLGLRGELDIATAPELRAAVKRGAAGGASRVVLDFAGVTFCDSQGLSALISLNKELSGMGGQLVLTNLGEFMQRLLDMTGLRAAFAVE